MPGEDKSPGFLNANHESVASQPLPRRSSRKRPPPTQEAGGRKPTPSKRARETDDDEEEQSIAASSESRLEPVPAVPEVIPPAPPRRQRQEEEGGRAARKRTMSAVRRARGEEEEKEEEAKDDKDDDDDEDRAVSQRRRSVALWIVVLTWCLSWVAIGIRQRRPSAKRTYQEWLFSELRGRDAWQAHEQYTRNLSAVHRSFRDVEVVGNDAMTLLDHYTKTRDRIDSLAKRFFDRDDALRRAADDATKASQEAKDVLATAPWHAQVMAKIAAVTKTLTTTPGLVTEEDDEVSKKAVVRKATAAALEAAAQRTTTTTTTGSPTKNRKGTRVDEAAIGTMMATKLDAALRRGATFDYASIRTGGIVMEANTTAAYATTLPWSQRLFASGRSASTVISTPGGPLPTDVPVGSCWAFPGQTGTLAVQLAVPTKPTTLALTHGFGDHSAAPKILSLVGFPTLFQHDGSFDLGTFSFHPDNNPQTFHLRKPPVDIAAVKMKVLDNHGHANFTCIYRLALYS